MFKKNKNKIIIFGRNGFIASAIINILEKNNYKIKSFSKNELDLLNEDSFLKIDKVLKKDDVVLFCSALAPVKNYSMFFKNIKMSENFCKIKKKNMISAFFYLSSDAVYSDSMKRINENSETNPDSLHGLMHITREKIFSNFFSKKFYFIRPTLVYGKNDPHNGYGPNKFYREAKNKKKIEIFGNGEEIRDHICIDDVARSFLKILRSNKFSNYNFVTGKEISFMHIAKIIQKFFKGTKIKKLKREGKMPHNGYRVFDAKKLKKINSSTTSIADYFIHD